MGNILNEVQDKVGNLVIKRPGSGGGELAPIVVIQGHVDMVRDMLKLSLHACLCIGCVRGTVWSPAGCTVRMIRTGHQCSAVCLRTC